MANNATISFAGVSGSVYENTASYNIGLLVRTASSGLSTTAAIVTASSPATAVLGTDYKLIYNGTTYSSSAQLPIYVTWADAETTTKYITASIIDNSVYTGTSSSFKLTFDTASSTNLTRAFPYDFRLDILDYESGYPSFSNYLYSVGESGTTVSLNVNRLSGSNGPLNVAYSSSNKDAIAGVNYGAVSGTLSWLDGDSTSRVISAPIFYDGVYSPSNKYFQVDLYNLSTGSFGSHPNAISSSIVEIIDQEPGTFNWEITSSSVTEPATSSSISFNVVRTSGSYGIVQVNISGSSSLNQAIRTTMTGSLTFPDSITTQSFTINVTNDSIQSTNDIIYYRLSPTASSGTAFTGSSGTLYLTVLDNEYGTVTFTGSGESIYENHGPFYIPVLRFSGSSRSETASIAYSGDAVEGVDYNVIYNGVTQTSPFNIYWNDQDSTTRYITASIYDNQTLGPSFKHVNFTISSSSISTIGTSSFVLNILDYEEGIPSFTSASYYVGEASGSLKIYFDRISGSQGYLSASGKLEDITAVSGINYTDAGVFSLNWAPGNADRQDITIPILYDGVQTSNLTFKASIFNLSTGSFSSYPNAISSSIITITDQEPGKFRFSSSSYSVIEGQTLDVTVERYSGSFGQVTLKATSSVGTGSNAAAETFDFTPVFQPITFNNGQTSHTFQVFTVENSTDVTGSLYFNLGLTDISSAYGTSVAGTPSVAPVYIIDNETGSVRFANYSHETYYESMAGSTANVYLERYNGADFAATATIDIDTNIVGNIAVPGVDYVNIFPYNATWADQIGGIVTVSIQTLASNVWSGDKIIPLKFTTLVNVSTGNYYNAAVEIRSGVITESTPSNFISPDYTINDYTTLSCQYTRRVENVPYRFIVRGSPSIRGSRYKITKE